MIQKLKKDNLIYQEADKIIPQKFLLYKDFPLTIKGNTLIPLAGIDESNGNGYYILWPKNISALVKQIHHYLQKKLKYTMVNIVDALLAMATVFMEEGNEQTPMVLLQSVEFVKFSNKETFKKLIIPEDKDLYYPLLKIFRKKMNNACVKSIKIVI